MSDPWTEDDTGKSISDPVQSQSINGYTHDEGFTFRYNRVSGIAFFSFNDGALFSYNKTTHVFNMTANGASIGIDASGNINLVAGPGGDIKLVTDVYTDSVNTVLSTFNVHTHGGVHTGTDSTLIPNQILP